MTYGQNPPSIEKTAFECPHCGAYTSQRWYRLLAKERQKDSTPHIPGQEFVEMINSNRDMVDATRSMLLEWQKKLETRLVVFEKLGNSEYADIEAENLNLSECYVCSKISVWVHHAIASPLLRVGPLPNSDMPPEIARDFEEARGIVGLSARGAAALLRLCVQKMCDHLGHKGKTIDDAISALVAGGLNPVVQQALDAVRVIGNEAVHPGTMDLRDDIETAQKLFKLVNIIVDRTISDPKQVSEIYDGLPETKRAAIDARAIRNKPIEEV